jgi:hypothetical protein
MHVSKRIALVAIPMVSLAMTTAAYAAHSPVSSGSGPVDAAGSVAPKLPAPPPGAVALGQLADIGSACSPGSTWIQSAVAPSTASYTTPFAGVITSWSTNANAVAGSVTLATFKPSAVPPKFDLQHKSAKTPVTPSTVNTFASRITVSAGELLGLFVSTMNMNCISIGEPAGSVAAGAAFDPDAATVFNTAVNQASETVNLRAILEPDKDADGFGDVSQDLCPASAQTQAACPAPVTTVTKKPKKSTTKPKNSIVFSSSVAGSTFTCSIDGKAFSACTSPLKKKFKVGQHVVLIRAASPFGPVEATPVIVAFKVKAKR